MQWSRFNTLIICPNDGPISTPRRNAPRFLCATQHLRAVPFFFVQEHKTLENELTKLWRLQWFVLSAVYASMIPHYKPQRRVKHAMRSRLRTPMPSRRFLFGYRLVAVLVAVGIGVIVLLFAKCSVGNASRFENDVLARNEIIRADRVGPLRFGLCGLRGAISIPRPSNTEFAPRETRLAGLATEKASVWVAGAASVQASGNKFSGL